MNEFFLNQKAFVDILLVALMGILTWLGRNALRRLEHLEKDTLRKSDLDALQRQLRAEHQENSKRLGGIESSITGTHRRIDDLFTQLLGGRGNR